MPQRKRSDSGTAAALGAVAVVILGVLLVSRDRRGGQSPDSGYRVPETVVQPHHKPSDLPNLSPQTSGAVKEQADPDEPIAAIEAAHQYVRNELVAPVSATFPMDAPGQDAIQAVKDNVHEYVVSGVVEYQSALGGQVRSTWVMRVHKQPDGKFTLLEKFVEQH